MELRPKVSIIIPSFNQGEFLEETLLSVINQSYINTEILVIDGGSTDGSLDLIKKYENYISYWVSEPDNGQAEAINKGFKLSSGDLLCWVNSDDVLYPDFIERRVAEFAKYPYTDMIYGDVDQGWDRNHSILRKGSQQSWREMITTCTVKIPQMSAIWKKQVYETIGELDSSLNVLLDWEYFVRIARDFRILYIPESVAFFRQHLHSKSVKFVDQWAKELVVYYENNIFNNKAYKELNHKHIKQNLFLVCSSLYLESSNQLESKRFMKEAIKLDIIRFVLLHIPKKSARLLINLKRIFRK